jgi:lipopolysaccharide transport system ATP-binding protein
MKRAEIRTKFDEIVEFAEVERFLDTQVKHYSSGMYVRLAFAVAAHLDPEILIVDEVLAVGDAAFQKKCLGKMNAVATQQGRTILFVTHNMGMITALCSKAILLQGGTLTNTGSAASIVVQYYGANAGHSPARCEFTDVARRPGDKYARLVSCSVVDPKGNPASEHDIQSPIGIQVVYKIESRLPEGITYPQINLYTATGDLVFQSLAPSNSGQHREPGVYRAECTIPPCLLNNDTYHLGIGLATAGSFVTVHFYEENLLTFTVKEDLQATLHVGRNGYVGQISGPVRPALDWSIKLSPVT